MTELGWTPITLPSHGLLYTDQAGAPLIPDGEVQIKAMTMGERAILEESAGSGPDRVAKLIERCCKLPKGIKHDDLLASDRLAILFALRAKTFGGEYSFKWTCESCGATNQAKIDTFEELNEDTPERLAEKLTMYGRIEHPDDFDYKEPFELELEDAKDRDGNPYRIGLRHLRGKDEARITKHAKRNQNQGTVLESALTYRLTLILVTINGEPAQGREKSELISNLSYRDSLRIDNFLSERETGIDMTVFLECPKCGATNETALPMTSEFFRPTGI